MPPKKPPTPLSWPTLLQTFKKMDGTTLYRFAMFIIMLSVTPLSVFLPPINGYKPLWSTVTEFHESNGKTQKKLDEVSDQLTDLKGRAEALKAQVTATETQVKGVEAKVQSVDNELTRLRSSFTGFKIDFEKYRKTQPNQPPEDK